MKELLTAAESMWQLFFGIFVKGLINFDNPLLSIIDYVLWGSTLISIAKKLLRKR